MVRATSIIRYMGILSILLISMRLGPANVAIRYDCGVEDETLKKTLAINSTQPDEIAYSLTMEGPGNMAVMAGDMKHILHWVPVEVKYRHVDKCLNRLPVERGIDNMYLMPQTCILTKNASEVPCTKPLLEHNKLEGNWPTPQPVDNPAPMILKPSSEITRHYENPPDQMKMEKQEDLHSMQKLSHWSFTIISGLVIVYTGIQFVSKAIAGIYSTLKDLEFLFHIVMNAYTLHFKHGWSIRRILGDIWISPTDFALLQIEEEYQEECTSEFDGVVIEKKKI